MGTGFLVLAGLVVVSAIWFWSMSLDKDRIAGYVGQRGGRIVSISWAPFGRGWFGEKGDRIYEVVYYDSDGAQHFATCKTSLFSGVYWTEDRVSHHKADWFEQLPPSNVAGDPIVRRIPLPESDESDKPDEPIDAEIARLKARLAELERRKARAAERQ